MVKGKYDGVVCQCIKQGVMADANAINPYTHASERIQFHAWSAGHFDRWGRV